MIRDNITVNCGREDQAEDLHSQLGAKAQRCAC